MSTFDGISSQSHFSIDPFRKEMEGIDPDLATWILNLNGSIEPVKFDRPIYYVNDGSRLSKKIPVNQETLRWVANHLKYALNVSSCPDIIYLIAASWFLTHLGLSRKEPELLYPFNKSIMIRTGDARITQMIKKLYWVLRDLYYPNQSCQEGLVKYDSLDVLFDPTSGWVRFHVVSMTHLPPDRFDLISKAIGYQSSSLFIDRWPLICISDPAQAKVSRGFFNINL